VGRQAMVSDKQHQVTEKAMGAAVDDIQDQSALNEEVNARLVNDSESREAAESLYSTLLVQTIESGLIDTSRKTVDQIIQETTQLLKEFAHSEPSEVHMGRPIWRICYSKRPNLSSRMRSISLAYSTPPGLNIGSTNCSFVWLNDEICSLRILLTC
jgi:hypothetical protein